MCLELAVIQVMFSKKRLEVQIYITIGNYTVASSTSSYTARAFPTKLKMSRYMNTLRSGLHLISQRVRGLLIYVVRGLMQEFTWQAQIFTDTKWRLLAILFFCRLLQLISSRCNPGRTLRRKKCGICISE